MRSLKVIIRATDRCNQDCRYCYVSRNDRKGPKEVLPLESLDHLFKVILSGEAQYVSVVWHGGEPTMVGCDYMTKALNLQRKHTASGVEVDNSIQTNATVLTDAMIQLLVKYDVGVGVSLDAPYHIHNAMRVDWLGRPSYKKVIEGIDRLKAAGIHFGAICVLNRLNVHLIPDIYSQFKSVGLSFQLNPFYSDEAVSNAAETDLSISPEEYGQALIQLFDLYVNDSSYSIDVTDLRHVIESLMCGKSRNCQFQGRCHEYIGILPDGSLYLCDHFSRPGMRIGLVNELSFRTIIRSKPSSKIRTRPRILRENGCKDCQWWMICKGGCSSKAGAVYGDVLREDPFCAARKQLFAHAAKFLYTEGERR